MENNTGVLAAPQADARLNESPREVESGISGSCAGVSFARMVLSMRTRISLPRDSSLVASCDRNRTLQLPPHQIDRQPQKASTHPSFQ